MSDFPDITIDNFDEKVLQTKDLVMAFFWAEWSGPCYMAEPILKEVVEEYGGLISLVKINSEKEKELLNKYKISNIPTILFFYNGEVQETLYGAVPKIYIIDKIRRICNDKDIV